MLRRKPLRADVRDELLGRIAGGRLPAGQRINESRLADELGVSRTPLRESLITLAEKGLLVSSQGRGFLVQRLDSTEAADACAVLAMLEPRALRLAGLPPTGETLELGNVLSRVRLDPRRSETVVKALLHWTALLLRACPNARLLTVIDDLHLLLYRYDCLYLARSDPQPTLELYGSIMTALQNGNLDDAVNALEHLLTTRSAQYRSWAGFSGEASTRERQSEGV